MKIIWWLVKNSIAIFFLLLGLFFMFVAENMGGN